MIEWLRKEYGIKITLVTKGQKGVTVYFDEKRHHVPGIKIKVEDTVGAGDAFSAAFLKE